MWDRLFSLRSVPARQADDEISIAAGAVSSRLLRTESHWSHGLQIGEFLVDTVPVAITMTQGCVATKCGIPDCIFDAIRDLTSLSFEGRSQAAFTVIFFAAFCASTLFGIVTVRTPFLKLASILSASTPSGTWNERWKDP